MGEQFLPSTLPVDGNDYFRVVVRTEVFHTAVASVSHLALARHHDVPEETAAPLTHS